MRKINVQGGQVLALMAAGTLLVGCGDSPTEPGGDDVNPSLLEGGNAMGLSSGEAAKLPQGQARFDGPGGMPMDATAEEFVQQLTLQDGTVLKTSGIFVRAVPDESVEDAPFHMMSFGSAVTGSHASVGSGTYTITGEWPEVDFIQVIPVTYGRIRDTAGPGSSTFRADSGELTIESVSYFDDVYTCEASGTSLVFDVCEYQIGVLEGTIEMTITTSSGELVQQRTDFTVPIKRETVFARPTGN